MKKTVYTLNVNNYAPCITELTYPLLKYYAHKIGAELVIINKRKYPKWPPVYEKLQIYDLAPFSDWNIYFDSDTLIHPDLFDITDCISKDTVMHNGADMAAFRWRYDNYFRRDGRNIGSCNWFTVASDWCRDLWTPLTDLTMEQAFDNIYPIAVEKQSGVITREHLIDDYVLSRNIAKYGLKFISFNDFLEKNKDHQGNFLWHEFLLPTDEKVVKMKEVLSIWKI